MISSFAGRSPDGDCPGPQQLGLWRRSRVWQVRDLLARERRAHDAAFAFPGAAALVPAGCSTASPARSSRWTPLPRTHRRGGRRAARGLAIRRRLGRPPRWTHCDRPYTSIPTLPPPRFVWELGKPVGRGKAGDVAQCCYTAHHRHRALSATERPMWLRALHPM